MNRACGAKRSTPWLFLAPAMVLLGAFTLMPLLRAAAWSFTSADLLNIDTHFLGDFKFVNFPTQFLFQFEVDIFKISDFSAIGSR